MEYRLLNTINSPADLKRLNNKDLIAYSDELRHYIIEECAKNPGHLASGLGVVELTVALHYVFDTPYDKLVWDVGHQTYPHKIITERRAEFPAKRCKGGISGFPRMCESEYDAFGGGHSSVSISAAFGMAKAAELKGEDYRTVAIIGDGSMTGGLAFEGLNNAGASKDTNLLVILNDNDMAIDEATGALKRYLLRISTSRRYNRFKQALWRVLSHVPPLLHLCQVVGNAVKRGILRNSNLFESFNFRYFGPVDGHNIPQLIRVLKSLNAIEGPKLLHIRTVKGKGFSPAEKDMLSFHAPGHYDPVTGERFAKKGSADRYQDVFGQTLLELAQMDSRVVGITPAMLSGCSMNILKSAMPSRCFDVGIAEGHAVTYSAGLAAAGMVPFCNIYSTFSQRAYDNMIHDVALQKLHVVLALDRGGLVGEDGATHHGAYDLACYSAIPNLTVMAPRNELELRNMLYTALQNPAPYVVRYPRGSGEGVAWRNAAFEMVEIGRGEKLRDGEKIALLTLGTTAGNAARAIDECSAPAMVAHYDMRYAKPLDYALLEEVASKYKYVVTIEDGALRAGVGEAIAAYFIEHNHHIAVKSLGIPDCFIEHGTPTELQAECGYDKGSILELLNKIIGTI